MSKADTKPDARFAIPDGSRPEEFLNDAQLAEYHARALADVADEHPDRPALARAAVQSARAALMTADALELAEQSATAELDAAAASKPAPKK